MDVPADGNSDRVRDAKNRFICNTEPSEGLFWRIRIISKNLFRHELARLRDAYSKSNAVLTLINHLKKYKIYPTILYVRDGK